MKIIGTHSGRFHADECLACGILQLTKEFGKSVIVRSRNPSVLEKCDILVDVGAVYDPSRHKYDHHQRSFEEFSKNKIKLSSAGLIYRHFGLEVLEARFSSVHKDKVGLLYEKIQRSFIEAIDANDNGVSISGDVNLPRYQVVTDLPSRIGRLNPSWLEPEESFEGKAIDGFQKALQLAITEFLSYSDYLVENWLPAREIVQQAVLESRKSVDSTGFILYLPQYCQWEDILYEIEKEHENEVGLTKFVIFQDRDKSYRIRAVNIEGDPFKLRLPLLEAWRGQRDADLEKISGIEGISFVHPTGFIGGAKTLFGALEMGRKTLESDPAFNVIKGQKN